MKTFVMILFASMWVAAGVFFSTLMFGWPYALFCFFIATLVLAFSA